MNSIKAGVTEGVVSIIVNTILFAAKFWAGIMTGSLALIADAWHTLSDSISSVFVIIGAKLSQKKADSDHPFGHGRWDQITTLFIAVFLGIIAYDFAKASIEQFSQRTHVEFGIFAIVVTSLSILVKELLAQYAFYLARKTGNESVRADGWHHRTDALSSVIVLIGILFAKQFWWIDSVLGFIVALMIFYATVKILKGAINKMLGEKPSQEFIDCLTNDIINFYDEDMQLHHLHIHNYITHKELTLHIRLNKDLSIENGHEIASAIEKLILDKYNIASTIHVEPLFFNSPVYKPVDEIK